MTEIEAQKRLEQVQNLPDLRAFVHQTLCDRENILLEQFPLKELTLTKAGRQCGWQFAVQGPRSVRLQAIWDADHNLLYFYDARGTRFLKLRLPQRIPAAA